MNHFPESLHERYRKTENFRSINDLGNYVRKECKRLCVYTLPFIVKVLTFAP